MFIIKNKITAFISLLILLTGLMLNSCKKDESDAVELLSWGPSPALRGGELKFIGNNLNKVNTIVLPDNIEITTFNTFTPELITLTVPEETVDGYVLLRTGDGDIYPKTMLIISEPITIDTIVPSSVRPGDIISIQGDYFNLVNEVIFTDKISVTEFVSHTKTEIEVAVPLEAQTGVITLSNGDTIPLTVESAMELIVAAPAVTSMTPNPVKPGTNLTITGTNLDLTTQIEFSITKKVSSFESISATQIVVEVPVNALAGPVSMIPASGILVAAPEELAMIDPVITGISPDPAKTGQDITVTGTNLDLVNTVTFGGGSEGSIVSGSTTELTVTVPEDALEDVVTFITVAGVSVVSDDAISLVLPTITDITPLSLLTKEDITITGTDLDIVAAVRFTGGKEAQVSGGTDIEITATVPPGSLSGTVTLITTNGSEVNSVQSLTITPNLAPEIVAMPAMAAPGEMIEIKGFNMDVFSEVIFPIDLNATMFGLKNDTIMQVYVPLEVKLGPGTIIFITDEGEYVESPEITFVSVDPVVDPALIIFDFDTKNPGWHNGGTIENDPILSLDGSNYLRVDLVNQNGWITFGAQNSDGGTMPGNIVGTNVSDYVVKVDIKVIDPITAGRIRFRFQSDAEGDFWYNFQPWVESGPYTTPNWITITIPLTDFHDSDGAGTGVMNDMSTFTKEWGINWDGGPSNINLCIDNYRFELIE
ncbi:MAG: IPT/TIG domain-containing protein [Bacteroidales bacterium]|nr:IPT/TIG domain-containing protein [Bacteroidales bacterium]